MDVIQAAALAVAGVLFGGLRAVMQGRIKEK